MRTAIVIMAILAWLTPATGADRLEQRHFFIELETETFSEMEQTINCLESLGLTTRHIITPNRIIAIGPSGLAATPCDQGNWVPDKIDAFEY